MNLKSYKKINIQIYSLIFVIIVYISKLLTEIQERGFEQGVARLFCMDL